MKFFIESEGIVDGKILDKYGKRSDEIVNEIPQRSMPLSWGGFPSDTKSFVVIFIDYDNYADEGVSWLHWSVANIPAAITRLEENCSLDIKKIDERIIQGKNSWVLQLPRESGECNRYGGPAPMAFPHEYEMRIYAMNDFLDLEDGYYHNELMKLMKGKILDEAVIYGVYNN